MNIKQVIVLAVALVAILALTLVMPRYKIHYINSENFIITEQSSPLYTRSLGEVRRHWDRILPIGGGILLVGGILCFLLRNKRR